MHEEFVFLGPSDDDLEDEITPRQQQPTADSQGRPPRCYPSERLFAAADRLLLLGTSSAKRLWNS